MAGRKTKDKKGTVSCPKSHSRATIMAPFSTSFFTEVNFRTFIQTTGISNMPPRGTCYVQSTEIETVAGRMRHYLKKLADAWERQTHTQLTNGKHHVSPKYFVSVLNILQSTKNQTFQCLLLLPPSCSLQGFVSKC